MWERAGKVLETIQLFIKKSINTFFGDTQSHVLRVFRVQSSKGWVCALSWGQNVLPVLTLALSAFCLQWLRNPGPQHEKRTLFGDMVCFLFITPLATVSGWLCLRGAVDHLHFSSRLEAVGLIALTVALFTIYLFWTLVSTGALI